MEELIKEVFAQYGSAYYFSECLYTQLCIMYALGRFQSKRDITRPRVEEKLSFALSLTLGSLAEGIKDIVPEELYSDLDAAVRKRNFIAHHFWFERAHLMFSVDGLEGMRDELISYALFFKTLDNKLERAFLPVMRKLGISDDMVQKSFAACVAGKPMDPLPKKRKLNKQEQIICAYNIAGSKGGITLVLQTRDGELWQLCDVGLGWTAYNEPQPDWTINEVIQKYLPATINPRPSISNPWCYEFTLSKGVVFLVNRDEKTGLLKWGIEPEIDG